MALPEAPPTPANWRIAEAGDGFLDTRWTDVEGETAYEIAYNTTGVPPLATANPSGVTIIEIARNRTRRVLTGLRNGRRYYLWIRSKLGVKEGAGTAIEAHGSWGEATGKVPRGSGTPIIGVGLFGPADGFATSKLGDGTPIIGEGSWREAHGLTSHSGRGTPIIGVGAWGDATGFKQPRRFGNGTAIEGRGSFGEAQGSARLVVEQPLEPGRDFRWDGAAVVPARLVPPGTGIVYLKQITVARSSVYFIFSTNREGSPQDEIELTARWEGYVRAISLSSSAGIVTLKGPGHRDNTSRATEPPYSWTPDNHAQLFEWARGSLQETIFVELDDRPPAIKAEAITGTGQWGEAVGQNHPINFGNGTAIVAIAEWGEAEPFVLRADATAIEGRGSWGEAVGQAMIPNLGAGEAIEARGSWGEAVGRTTHSGSGTPLIAIAEWGEATAKPPTRGDGTAIVGVGRWEEAGQPPTPRAGTAIEAFGTWGEAEGRGGTRGAGEAIEGRGSWGEAVGRALTPRIGDGTAIEGRGSFGEASGRGGLRGAGTPIIGLGILGEAVGRILERRFGVGTPLLALGSFSEASGMLGLLFPRSGDGTAIAAVGSWGEATGRRVGAEPITAVGSWGEAVGRVEARIGHGTPIIGIAEWGEAAGKRELIGHGTPIIGTGSWGEARGGARLVPAPVGAPVITAMAKSETARFGWPAVTDATSYIVAFGTDPDHIQNPTVEVTDLWFIPPNDLMNNTLYYCGVRAKNSDGEGPTAVENTRPQEALGARAPGNAAALPGSQIATLTWDESTDADDYDIAYGSTDVFADAVKVEDQNDIGPVELMIVDATAPENDDGTPELPRVGSVPYLRAPLVNGEEAWFWLRAVANKPPGDDTTATGWGGRVGPGPWTASFSTTPTDTGAPSVPMVTRDHILVGDTEATLAFDYVESNDEGLDFDYRFKRPAEAAWTEVTTHPTEPDHPDIPSPNFTIPDLERDTTYEVQVRAKNVNGPSAWSATVTLTTLAVPSGFSVQGDDEAVDMEWNADAAAVDYDYRYREPAGEWQEVIDTIITGDSWRATGGFANGVTYQMQIRARNENSITYWTASIEVTPVLPQDEFPTGLAAVPGPAQIVATWNRAAGANGYDYRIRVGMIGTWNVVNAGNTIGVVITGLRGGPLIVGELYQIAVRARNAGGGVSGWSDAVSVIPADSVVEPPNVVDIAVAPRSGSLDIFLQFQNDMPGAVTVASRLDVQVLGSEFANAYELPEDLVHIISVVSADAPADTDDDFQAPLAVPGQTSPAADGNLIYTNIQNPLLIYVARGTEDQIRGAFTHIATLLLAAKLARKWKENTQESQTLFAEYERQLLLALASETAIVDTKAIKTEAVTDVKEQE